ncbi:MAG TPA: hypothetical protein VN371_01780 [Chlorobaculum sp.]|nr:hypothetical protein [Chlorobaculum sp.]
MSDNKESRDPLVTVSEFTDTLTSETLGRLLDAAGKAGEEKALVIEQYKALKATVETMRKAFLEYEKDWRPGIEAAFAGFSDLLKKGSEYRAELIRQYGSVCLQAEKINCLDRQSIDSLGELCNATVDLRIIPAFHNALPSETEWPEYGLSDVFDRKNSESQEFWNSAYALVQPGIDAATADLKKREAQLESIVKAMTDCISVVKVLGKVFGLAAAVG